MDFENIETSAPTINYREKVLRLITEGKIKSYGQEVVETAEYENLEKIYNDYQRKQLDETNEKISKSLIKQFSGLMSTLELVENDNSLENDLNENDLFKRDMKNEVGIITLYILFIGLVCGAICLANHIWKRKTKTEEEPIVQRKLEDDEMVKK